LNGSRLREDGEALGVSRKASAGGVVDAGDAPAVPPAVAGFEENVGDDPYCPIVGCEPGAPFGKPDDTAWCGDDPKPIARSPAFAVFVTCGSGGTRFECRLRQPAIPVSNTAEKTHTTCPRVSRSIGIISLSMGSSRTRMRFDPRGQPFRH
jgi:hypothetical protein